MLRVSGALDLETENWDRYVVGGLLVEGAFTAYWRQADLYDMLIALSTDEEPRTLWAWNGGRYDFLWICQMARQGRQRWEINTAGSRITSMKLGNLELRDACALVALFTLEKAYSLAGVDGAKMKNTGLVCRCGQDCGGYCRIRRRGMTKAEKKRLITYLERDCRGTVQILDAYLAEFERAGYETRGTIGASAWATAQKLCSLPSAKWDPGFYDLARAGYFGGRCEVYQTRAPAGYRYDLRSAYPAALRETALPIGDPMLLAGPTAERAFNRGREGIYQARVHVPDMRIPPLPTRLGERVVYPVGPIIGSWTGLELRAAREAGAEIEKIDLGLVWPDSEPVLRPFVELCYANRSTYEDDSPWRKVHKNVPNSCVGKLAEIPDRTAVVLFPDPTEIVACEADWECHGRCGWQCCVHRCSGKCGAWRALDLSGEVWARPFYRLGSSAHVHWAAYVTASVRITLRAQLLGDDDGASAIYCDTDSCYSIRPRKATTRDILGSWAFEGRMANWTALAPKMYRFLCEPGCKDHRNGGQWHVRAKGLPGMDEPTMRAFERGETLHFDRGVQSIREAARAGGQLFVRRHLTRTRRGVAGFCGGRQMDGATLTRPLPLAILRQEL